MYQIINNIIDKATVIRHLNDRCEL